MTNIKDQFPIFKNIPDLVYLDNAATTQKPSVVIDKLVEVYTQYNSNVHRGLYTIAEKANIEYELAREKVAKLINADKDEIVFTSGTTDATNLIAQSLLLSGMVSDKSKVLTTEFEHHASFLPWQRIAKDNIEYAKQKDNKLEFSKDTQIDVVAYSVISNVTGKYTDINELRQGKLKNALFIADAAQAVAHIPIDVKQMNTDFLVFSGHKMFGPTGIGVLYGKKELLEKMEPFKVGGGMIDKVEKEYSTWTNSPEKFEAGTPAIADAIALGAAVDYIQSITFDHIIDIESKLRIYALEKLKNIPDITIYHSNEENSGSVISFTIKNIHPHDIAQFLGDRNICVRAGHHCTQILHRDVFEIPATVRVSLSIYNTQADVDTLIKAINDCINYFSAFGSN